MTALEIKSFALDRDSMPLAILKETNGPGALLVGMNPTDAGTIIAELENLRPDIHSAFIRFFLQHGFTMDQLEIYARSSSGDFDCRVCYHRGLKQYQMEIDPSEGLVLAVSLNVPILASVSVLIESPLLPAYGCRDPQLLRLRGLNLDRDNLQQSVVIP